ncbi:sulfotransferase family protein [Striga asiatica]|uniref:Sulfotransferase n=1 Tax=Striga asiatica TaxID=4170 RepID=A0A5A7Q7X4_STRAF|nr:sulfotransferase family protein [Striga asiatica]
METNSNPENISNSSLQREKWCGHQFLYKFHGFWFTQTYLETTKRVVENFKPLPNDVILCSFPKTGTTWLKALLHSITHRSDESNLLISKHPQELIPSLETNLYVRHVENNEKSPESLLTLNEDRVRILGTHIPYQILGNVLNSSECKIVYMTRNPKDTLISLWHFVRKSEKVEEDPWELEAAVDQFCNGIVVFGSYYDHVLAYREESVERPDKVFLVTYEEMKENPKECVEELGKFLGCPFDEGENGAMEISEIVRNCSFENLSNQGVNKSSELPDGFPLPYSSFFRKGKVGDYKNYLDDEMIQKIDSITREKFHRSVRSRVQDSSTSSKRIDEYVLSWEEHFHLLKNLTASNSGLLVREISPSNVMLGSEIVGPDSNGVNKAHAASSSSLRMNNLRSPSIASRTSLSYASVYPQSLAGFKW